MPGMVMQKFHNLRGGMHLPHRFYEVTGGAGRRVVRFTPALRQVAMSEQAAMLWDELGARWDIVETSFTTEIGRSLIEQGVAVDLRTLRLTDRRRRRPVTGVTEAVIGFQHGRCLICQDPITPADEVAVDHVFPYALMKRFPGLPDLDVIWNLAPAHAACNGRKSDRLPTSGEQYRLALRNQAIMHSPHPLRRTLVLTLKRAGYQRGDQWPSFIRGVFQAIVQ